MREGGTSPFCRVACCVLDPLCLACSRLIALGLISSNRFILEFLLKAVSPSPTLICAPVVLYFVSSSRAAGVILAPSAFPSGPWFLLTHGLDKRHMGI